MHTHFIGKVFSAYVVDGATKSHWTLIGKADPSLPQGPMLCFLKIFLEFFFEKIGVFDSK
jgi:hypothetical protein